MRSDARRRLRALLLVTAETIALARPAVAGPFTDSAQRQVQVPDRVQRIDPANSSGQILLHALAPGKLAGLVAPFPPEHAIYVDPAILALPQVPDLMRTAAPGDQAAVRVMKPSLVVASGVVDARTAAAANEIQAALPAPTLLLSNDLAQSGDLVHQLADAVGASERGTIVEAALNDALAKLKPLETLADADRLAVYVGGGSDGLTAVGVEDPSLEQAIRLAGGRNVVPSSTGASSSEISAIVAMKPAVVIVSESEATHGALRAALPTARFILDAGEPYRTLTGPASINRLAGVLALAAILHPDKVKIDDEAATRLETALFPIPPGLSLPSPLQRR